MPSWTTSRHPREVPRSILRGLLGVGGTDAAEILSRYGVRAESVPVRRGAVDSAKRGTREGAWAASYRAPPRAPSHAQVVFWNDSKTTMAVVLDILRGVFTMTDTEATYLMLGVHHRGSAVVCIAEEREASALAARAEKVAREQGMPLRVTVERVGPEVARPSARRP